MDKENIKDNRIKCVNRCNFNKNDICTGCRLSLKEIKAGRIKFKKTNIENIEAIKK